MITKKIWLVINSCGKKCLLKTIILGYNSGYKRGRRASSLKNQRLYDSDFFESHVLRQNLALRDVFSGLFCCNGHRLYPLKFQYAARFLKLHVMYVVCILNCGNLGLWLGLRAPLMGLSTVYWHGTRYLIKTCLTGGMVHEPTKVIIS